MIVQEANNTRQKEENTVDNDMDFDAGENRNLK